jgi:16S rRNA (cytosine1402-N4)-methyltransferase
MSQAQLALPGLPADGAAEWVWSEDSGEEIDVPAFVHETVMRAEVVAALAGSEAERNADDHTGLLFVDATVGGGGHSEGLLDASPGSRLIAFDRDDVALAAARERLERFGDRVTFVKTPFGQISSALSQLGVTRVDGICADLGVSSPQLDDPSRGMSFRREGPIDMRMDPAQGETALELIDRLSDDELADVIFHYGDERRSRRIARSVKRALADGELATTLDLRRAIVRAVGPVRVGGVDPATRTFQALRIAVNGELEQLEELLAALPAVIGVGGRVAILSFHSLEDRLVKRAFHDRSTWEPLTKKPVVASEEEGAANARARSAKLRTARRIEAAPESGRVYEASSRFGRGRETE